MLESVRGQLNVDAARGTEVSRLLVVVRDALSSHAREDAGAEHHLLGGGCQSHSVWLLAHTPTHAHVLYHSLVVL